MPGKKNRDSSPPALPGANAPSSVQRSVTMDMPFLPDNGGGANTPSIGGSGHGGEGSSYYSRDLASSIHGETVRGICRSYGRSERFPRHERRGEREGAEGSNKRGLG